jgi:hypothetical protein
MHPSVTFLLAGGAGYLTGYLFHLWLRTVFSRRQDRELAKLRKFKEICHQHLDEMGVPLLLNEECRMNARFHWVRTHWEEIGSAPMGLAPTITSGIA